MRVITGKARGVSLKTPEGMLTRPTADRVKEALFSIIQFEIPGARVLDLFAGTGQLGIEALSRGAAEAVFVDARREACDLVRENLRRTGLSQQGSVVCADYMAALGRMAGRFDLVFLDPPYAEVFLENALKRLSEIDILQKRGIIVTERPLGKELDLELPGFVRSRDYKYGKTLLALYRRAAPEETI